MSDVDQNVKKETGQIQSNNTDKVHHEDVVDPRVQVELERLNTSTDLINKLEIELDDARSNFRVLLSESSLRVNQLAKKLGSCVEKARPYYESRMHAKQLQIQTQKAALRYERASSAHSTAKEMVFLAEEGLKKEGRCFDPAWQEMLNHATLRVNEAESERVFSQHEHQKTSLSYNEAEKIVQHLHQELKKSIVKSRPYFEMKAQFNQLLEEQRKKVHCLEENILKMKVTYADALHNLEEISDEIHQRRRSEENQALSERSETATESDNFSDGMKMPYRMLRSISSSSDNIYIENLNTEDMYRSLPSKISLRPGIIAASCRGNSSQKMPYRQSSEPVSTLEKCTRKLLNTPEDLREDSQYNNVYHSSKLNCETSSSGDGSSPISNHFEQLNLSGKFEENKSNGLQDKSFEGEEISDFKFLAPDFNLLRVQREELSDSESLASNDTTDTLDDNQIECLLLEKMLSSDMAEADSQNNCNNFEPKDSINL